MSQTNHFISGILIFLTVLVGSGWVTYQLLLDQPPQTNESTFVEVEAQPPSTPSPSILPKLGVETARSISPPGTASPRSQTAPSHPDEEISKNSSSSLAHASMVSVTVPESVAPTIAAGSEEQEGKKVEGLTLPDVPFGLSRSGLGKQAKAILDTYVEQLSDPKWSVLIQGHTDDTGSIRQNLRVGLRRANAVKQYLMEKGIPENRLHVVSLGEFQPVCRDSTPACQVQNRRVSFLVAPREPADMPMAQPVPTQKRPEGEAVVMSVEPVTLPDMGSQSVQPAIDADLTAVEADLKEFDAPVSRTDSVKMGPIYPEPVHSTPPPVR